jgi:HD-GYP domain-containing protein (c-di-GMP phosphodiesterase class II)
MMIQGEVFGVLHAYGKIKETGFDQQDLFFLSELTRRATLGLENNYLYESIFEVLMATLRSLVSTIEAKDPYTKQHSQRVTDLAVLIAEEMRCTPNQIDTLRVAGYLHDLGKLGVRDSILLKPGRLSEEEFEQIKTHPTIGESIIAPIGLLPEERALIRHHHERWDGKGYPDGLREKQIPFLARILSVADAFDAMTSDRPYRAALSYRTGLEEIVRCKGTQFDPQVVDAFQSTFGLLQERDSTRMKTAALKEKTIEARPMGAEA